MAEVGADLECPHQIELDAPTAAVALGLALAGEGISLVVEVDPCSVPLA